MSETDKRTPVLTFIPRPSSKITLTFLPILDFHATSIPYHLQIKEGLYLFSSTFKSICISEHTILSVEPAAIYTTTQILWEHKAFHLLYPRCPFFSGRSYLDMILSTRGILQYVQFFLCLLLPAQHRPHLGQTLYIFRNILIFLHFLIYPSYIIKGIKEVS